MKKGNSPRGEVYPGLSESNRAGIRGMSSMKMSEILEDELKRAEVDEERRRALQLLAQVCKYSIAVIEGLKAEHKLSYAHNRYEYRIRIYWKEEVGDERQRKLTDFI